MLKHKNLVSIIATIAFCLSFLTPAIIAPPALAASISALRVPVVHSDSPSEALGTVQVAVYAGSILSGDVVIFELPENCIFGADAEANKLVVPANIGFDDNGLDGKLAMDPITEGDTEVKIRAIADQAVTDSGVFLLYLGDIIIDGANGDLVASFDGPVSGFPHGDVVIGRTADDSEVLLIASGLDTSNNIFDFKLRIREDIAGALKDRTDSLVLTLPDGFSWKTLSGATTLEAIWGESVAVTFEVKDKELSINVAEGNTTSVASAWEIELEFEVVDESAINSGDILCKVKGKSNLTPSELKVGKIPGVTDVTLYQPITLTVGGPSVTLVAIVSPADAKNKDVIWSSSNEAVATVTNGVVTPVAAGSAVITVTTVDGGKTASCIVVVTAATSGGGGGGGRSTSSTASSGAVIIDNSAIPNTVTRKYDSGNNIETFTVKSTISTALAKALASGEESLEINVASTHSASTTIVTMPNDVLKAAEGLALQITTPKASIQVPASLVETLAAAGEKLTMKVGHGKVADINQAMVEVAGMEGAEILGTPTIIETALVGNTKVTIPLTGISIPSNSVEREEFLDSLGVFVIHDGDETQLIRPSIAYDANGPAISFYVDRFSTFAIVKLPSSQPVEDISGHWAKDNINALVKMGVITGYEDGTFRPDQNISRAEFAAILVKAFNLSTQSGKTFSDTQNHWAKQFVSTAYANNVVNGYSDSVFKPDNMITREQMAVMVANAGKLSTQKGIPDFSDNASMSVWAREAVLSANNAELIAGYPDNTFRPKNYATRAEAVTVVLKAVRL